jgi:hypothetical protein
VKTPPDRWTTRLVSTDAPADAEDRAGLLLRRAVVRQPLGARALADVWDRIPDERHPQRRRLLLHVCVALAFFLAGGGVVMSATLLGYWSPIRRSPEPRRAAPAPAAPARGRAVAAAASPVPEALPAPEPVAALRDEAPRRAHAPRSVDVVEAPVPTNVPAAAPEVVPAPGAAAPARPSVIAEESALLGAAMRRLREHDDAAGALALLDEHDGRFGRAGALGRESNTTRVEAWLRLGRFDRALPLLDALAPRPTGRDRDLLATRGELRVEAGRCPEALTDFEAVLGDDSARDLAAERALSGRAGCRARLGERDAARADLEAYLSRFPRGQYATRARAALDR